MAEIIIPGTDKVLIDGTILILSKYNNIQYIAHNGFYTYEGQVYNGWYGVSIPEQLIIPLTSEALEGCTIFYYPVVGCCKQEDNCSTAYRYSDKYQVERAAITVETMTERDALAPNLGINELPDGKIIRVNRPDNTNYRPKYYVYRHDIENNIGYWEELDVYIPPSGGIPEEDLAPELREKIDSALQREDLGPDFDTSSEQIQLSETGRVATCVLDWLDEVGGAYPAEDVQHNLERLQTIRDLNQEYQIEWGRNFIYINISDKFYLATVVRENTEIIAVTTVVAEQNQQTQYIISGTSFENYQQQEVDVTNQSHWGTV